MRRDKESGEDKHMTAGEEAVRSQETIAGESRSKKLHYYQVVPAGL